MLIHGLHFNNIKGDIFGGVVAAVIAVPKHSQRGERCRFTSLSLSYAKLKLVGQTKFERDHADLVRMIGEGVAKKEMARRTGLSVPTVRKYLKMIEV